MLASLQLEAFLAVAREKHVSRAAKRLGLTQPALSQRLLNLERELQLKLFARTPRGVELTEAGERLLRHARSLEQLDAELRESLGAAGSGGTLRLGAFSSILRPVILPALHALGKTPGLRLELLSREMSELPGLLRSGSIDYGILDHELEGAEWERGVLGHEENVWVAPANGPRPDVFLDHDADDPTTDRFFRLNGRRAPERRHSLDDVFGILDGVERGWGCAIVSRHLLAGRKGLKVVSGYKPLRTPVVLHFARQPFPTKLHQTVRGLLETEVQRRLS